MKFLYALTGVHTPMIKEFTIDETANIHAGELVVKNSDGVFSASSSGTAVGVAAEDHSGEKDILNVRSDKNRLMIDITKDAVYETFAPTLEATAEGTGKLTVSDYSASHASLAGSKIKLIAKGEGSTNPDKVGDVRDVRASTVSSGVLNVNTKQTGVISAGDVYAVFPPAAFAGDIGSDRNSFVLGGGVGTTAKVVDVDISAGTLEICLKNKVFD